jgi:hypothetical protein
MKNGIKTSEFWLAFLSVAMTFYLVISGLYEAEEFVELLMIVVLGYGSSRTLLKSKEPKEPT